MAKVMEMLRGITPLNWYKRIIKDQIGVLKEYLEVLEKEISILKTKQEQFIEEIEDNGNFYSYDTKQVLKNFDWMHRTTPNSMDLSDHGFYSDYIPYIQRYSTLIILYSFLELELKNICQYLCKKNERKIKPNDLNKSDGEIVRLFNYLQKVEDLEIKKGEVWKRIDNIRKIRNLIVHHNGILKEENNEHKKLKDYYIKNNPDYFECKNNLHLRITEKFLPDVLTTFNNFFLQIQTALEKKYAEHKS